MSDIRAIDCDLTVIGGGPAGASAAIEAASYGLSVTLIDEQAKAGGQVWRAKGPAITGARPTAESQDGDTLRSRLAASGAQCLFEHRVWQIQPDDGFWQVHATGEADQVLVRARAIILATGAQERVFPVPGWTLPGVTGLAAATAMMKGDMMLPGQQVLVAGAGPLLPFVAHEIHRHGGTVVAVVDLNSRRDWLGTWRGMLRRPDLMLRGATWVARLKLAGIPVFNRHGIRRIIGNGRVERAEIGPVADDWSPVASNPAESFEVDAVCLGHGLSPAIEATRMLDCRHIYDETTGGWQVETDEAGRTSVAGIYACGDGAGILGAAAAPLRGRIAAEAVAMDLGKASRSEPADPLTGDIATVSAFGRAMTSLTIPRPGIAEQITQDTIVCRCENLTRGDVEAGLFGGGISPNALKSETRCGMGPCGGRFCRETAALLTATMTGASIESIGLPTSRPPLRPLPVELVTRDFDYEELPIPAPAPL
jgi:thioredoxin reductase